MEINHQEVKYTPEISQYHYFACTCAEPDQNFWSRELQDYKDEDPNSEAIVTTMLYDLSFNLDTVITGVGVDMWMGISASFENDGTPLNIYLECDVFEYGLLAIIKIVRELKGE